MEGFLGRINHRVSQGGADGGGQFLCVREGEIDVRGLSSNRLHLDGRSLNFCNIGDRLRGYISQYLSICRNISTEIENITMPLGQRSLPRHILNRRYTARRWLGLSPDAIRIMLLPIDFIFTLP